MDTTDTSSGDQDAGGTGPGTRKADVRYAALGAGANILAIIAGLGMPVFHAVAARFFGAATYGLFSLGLVVMELTARFSPLGTDKGLLRHVARHRVAGETALVRSSLRTAYVTTVVGGLVLGTLAFLFAGPIATLQDKPDSAVAVRLLAPSTVFTALIVVFVSATMGAKVMRYNLLVRGVSQPLMLLALTLPVALFMPTLFGLCLAYSMATAITAFFAFWAARRTFARVLPAMPPQPAGATTPTMNWSMLRFSVPMGLSEFFNTVLQRADLVVLGLYAADAEVGLYAGAEFLSRVVGNVRNAFDPVASPVLSEAIRQKDRLRQRYNLQLMVRWVTVLTLPVLIFVAGFRADLLGLFGGEFVAAGSLLLLFLARQLVNGVLGLNGWMVAMAGHSRLVLANNVVCAVTNITLSFLLIPRWGVYGAALASLVAVTLIQVLQVLEVAWINRIHAFTTSLLKVMAAGAFTAGITLAVAPLVTVSLVPRLALGVMGILACYGCLLWMLGLPAEEREVLGKARDRLIGLLR